jgi:hypothetical protein
MSRRVEHSWTALLRPDCTVIAPRFPGIRRIETGGKFISVPS